MNAEIIRCPGCGAGLTKDEKVCPACGNPVVITTISSIGGLSMLQLSRRQNAYQDILNQSGGDDANVNMSLGLVFMKLGLYDRAIEKLRKAIDTCFDNPQLYLAAAMALLKGKKAFLATRQIIDEVENYIKIAIEIEPIGLTYLFWAYVRYDYFERKSFNVTPKWGELFKKAVDLGYSQEDAKVLFETLRVQVPECLDYSI